MARVKLPLSLLTDKQHLITMASHVVPGLAISGTQPSATASYDDAGSMIGLAEVSTLLTSSQPQPQPLVQPQPQRTAQAQKLYLDSSTADAPPVEVPVPPVDMSEPVAAPPAAAISTSAPVSAPILSSLTQPAPQATKPL